MRTFLYVTHTLSFGPNDAKYSQIKSACTSYINNTILKEFQQVEMTKCVHFSHWRLKTMTWPTCASVVFLWKQQQTLNRQNHHNTEVRFIHRATHVTGLTVGTLLLGGSGKGGLEDLRDTTAPMVEISFSNMDLMVLVWTRVRCGDSLACMHVRMYCRQDRTGNLFSYVHI